MEEEEGRGFGLGCRRQACAFCAGSCASVAAPGLRRRPPETARWTRRPACAVCTAGEGEERRSPLWGVCWKTEAASWSSEASGLCWESVGEVSLGFETKTMKVLCGWG